MADEFHQPKSSAGLELRFGQIRLQRFMRRHGGQLVISQIVLLEACNIFSRVTAESHPREWQALEADFDGRLYVDPMNWDLGFNMSKQRELSFPSLSVRPLLVPMRWEPHGTLYFFTVVRSRIQRRSWLPGEGSECEMI